MPYSSHTIFPPPLSWCLSNARSVNNKTHLVHDLIEDDCADLAYITETWLGGENDVNLSLVCSPGLGIQQQRREEDQAGGVNVVY